MRWINRGLSPCLINQMPTQNTPRQVKGTALLDGHGCLPASRQSKLDTSTGFRDGDGRNVWQDLCADIDLALNACLCIKEALGC